MTFSRYGGDRDFNFFIGNVRSLYYRLVRWNVWVWVFRRSFSVFVQYFNRVLKNVDNEQVRKPAICDVFVCKHWKETVGLPLGELEENRGRKTRLRLFTNEMTIVFVENGGKAKYCRVLSLTPGSTAGSSPGSVYRHPRGWWHSGRGRYWKLHFRDIWQQ